MIINIKLIGNGKVPEYKHRTDACCDCYANLEEDQIKIAPGKRQLVNLGFAIELPEDMEAVIRPRSGNSKNGIDIAIGTIDSGYTGEVKACVINNSGTTYLINNYDRICQLKIQKKEEVSFNIVDELKSTERGSNGFGSTGVK